MDFRQFYASLTDAEKKDFADRAGTTPKNIEAHYLSTPPRKIPRKDRMEQLAQASNGAVSMVELLEHFYGLEPTARSGKNRRQHIRRRSNQDKKE